MAQPVLAAQVREHKGKGAAKMLRKNNQVPAIFYGPKTEPFMLAVDYSELESILRQGTGENVILDLQIQSNQGIQSRTAMIKDIQIDPIKDTYLHTDFYEISMDQEITVGIPIHLINTPMGASKGGVLQHVQREVMITCLPDKLMDFLEIDVSGLDIGDSLRISDIELPEGVTLVAEHDTTIAVVAAPTVTPEMAEEEEEKVEGEGLEPGEESHKES
jgi:large subunit ribosomal protein L25